MKGNSATTGETADKHQLRIGQLEAQVQELAAVKQQLAEAESKYRLLVDNANDAIFVLQDGKVKFANPRAMEMGGILGEDLERFHYTEYLHPEERQKVVERHEKRLEGQKVLNMYPLRIVRRDGSIFWAEVNAVRIQWHQKAATLNIIRDITSQKLAEKQYFQTESLETLRTLSGGLAHSFNNLLMGIQGRVSLLKKKVDPKSELHTHLKGIESCVLEAAKLTEQMLGFSQSGKYRIVPIALEKLVDGVLASFDNSHRSITFKRHFALGLEKVMGDPHQLEQVVMNVLLNSWQAIAQEGWVMVSVDNFDMNEARQSAVHLPEGKWVKLAIQDNGVGMEQSVCKRVFEPFFTTKGMGQHRGLGLSSVFGIVANHNGVINIDSIPGCGTTVCIYLPAADTMVNIPS
jgi:two-component system cell cycle sensor histidine kinase/response regulator CckA